jgi:hypothetical protein
MIDRILEKPVYLDRLKNEVQELISTIDIQQKNKIIKIKNDSLVIQISFHILI